jgi:hypothetical protein
LLQAVQRRFIAAVPSAAQVPGPQSDQGRQAATFVVAVYVPFAQGEQLRSTSALPAVADSPARQVVCGAHAVAGSPS